MTDTIDTLPRWAVRCDVTRPIKCYDDLIKIVSSYYEMYERGARFLTPYISRQNGSQLPFIAPNKEEIKAAVGKPRSCIHPVVYHGFVNELLSFSERTKGKRQLISPHQTTHHSAQFCSGTFNITRAPGVKHSSKQVYQIELFSASEPIYVENLQLTPEQINFIIVRPKIGKLGTPSLSNWEVLLYKNPHSYLINHVDSDLNPRFSGVL